ncbi:MAG: mntH [Verrucomicrobiaceae bacterium]|nr:mntH [Verrucomicrobiaceae bacterium]
MVGIQIISARIGRVSGQGLAGNIREYYPRWLLYTLVALLVIANTINIAADIAAMGDAITLLAGGSTRIYALFLGVISLALQILIPYNRYVRVLKWLTLALLTYIATAFVVTVPWLQVMQSTVLPEWSWRPAYITTIVAIFGTTISPYLFFWQASQEVEELTARGQKPLRETPTKMPSTFRRIKIDTLIGMGFSNLVAFFIMLTAAVTLRTHGIHEINSSADAAEALRPIAGQLAFWLFSLGIIGTGLLAVPVLAGSAAYAMAGAFNWRSSLEDKFETARPFYLIIALATLIGTALCFTPINPIKALYWSAVINGVISVPIMAVMMSMASRKEIMGQFVIGNRLKTLGWLCTGAMTVAVIAMFCFQ